ncbi:MAG: PEGA domain-containing protein [Deltaproteobacteria bacterium]
MRRTLLAIAALGTFMASAPAQAAKTKRIRIKTDPKGAEVHLDDIASKPIGVTPVRVAILYGYHELIVMLDGYETQRIKLNVDRTTKDIDLSLVRLARLEISPVTGETAGAELKVDGRPVGTIPYKGFMVPGRHQLTIEKEGFSTFADWVELKSGEVFALSVKLEKAAANTGTLFVAADVDGATVKIDGVERGTAPVTLQLPVGPVLVEVVKAGLPPWTNTVQIAPNAKAIARATIRPKSGPTGTLLVIASVPGTSVIVDGVKTGTAPVTLDAITPGTHVVEGYKKGYDRAQDTVKVTAGEQAVVKLDIQIAKERYGALAVRSSEPGAIVYVDGSSRGRAPVELSQMKLGEHAIVVRKRGFLDFKASCVVKELEPCRIVADLVALAKIRVIASPMKGRLAIDDKDVGKIPYEGEVSATTHTLRVEAKDYEPIEDTITFVRSDEVQEIRFDLKPSETSTMAIAQREASAYARRKIQYAGATTYTGVPLGPGMSTIDFVLGAPYLLEVQGGTGIVDDLAGSVGLRFLERDTSLGVAEVVFGAHTGKRLVDAFSIGARGELFTGTNFSNIFDLGLSAQGMVTLHFGSVGAFTALIGADVVHDRWMKEPGISPDGEVDGDQTTARLFTGGRITYYYSDSWSIFGAADVTLAGEDRLLLQEVLFGAIDKDPRVYVHLGATLSY